MRASQIASRLCSRVASPARDPAATATSPVRALVIRRQFRIVRGRLRRAWLCCMSTRSLDESDFRVLFHAIERDLAAVGGDIEVSSNLEIRRKIGELALSAGFEIDEPEILVADVAAKHHDGSTVRPKYHSPRPPGKDRR